MAVKFNHMWTNFPEKDAIKLRCRNKQKDSDTPFRDYCAIMMSECFTKSGIDIGAFTGNRCWSHDGKKHILLAEDFAKGLNTHTPPTFKKRSLITPDNFQDELSGKTGVIFFKDYWQRGSENFSNRSGDHIDLWNKNK